MAPPDAAKIARATRRRARNLATIKSIWGIVKPHRALPQEARSEWEKTVSDGSVRYLCKLAKVCRTLSMAKALLKWAKSERLTTFSRREKGDRMKSQRFIEEDIHLAFKAALRPDRSHYAKEMKYDDQVSFDIDDDTRDVPGSFHGGIGAGKSEQDIKPTFKLEAPLVQALGNIKSFDWDSHFSKVEASLQKRFGATGSHSQLTEEARGFVKAYTIMRYKHQRCQNKVAKAATKCLRKSFSEEKALASRKRMEKHRDAIYKLFEDATGNWVVGLENALSLPKEAVIESDIVLGMS